MRWRARRSRPTTFATIGLLIFAGVIARAQSGENVDVPAGINHNAYYAVLKKYVNDHGLVNYAAWKQNKADVAALEDYVKQFARKADNAAHDNEKAASLVNSYLDFILRWILVNYPI
jgi:hypothetical protein